MKKILKDSFIKSLLEKAAGYELKNKILKIFHINDEISENLIKNRLSVSYKEIKIKNNSIFIKF